MHVIPESNNDVSLISPALGSWKRRARAIFGSALARRVYQIGPAMLFSYMKGDSSVSQRLRRSLVARPTYRRAAFRACMLGFSLLSLGMARIAAASQAYGSTNNFDCVNDTGSEAHGFDIELDDVRCSDITYTYDYNHYGVPSISEDLSNPLHPKVLVRYAAKRNPDGTWSAYTAIPAAPILPTMGHQFTNPSINFGGEHFGVGFVAAPSAVKYNWLVDDGAGHLTHGPDVFISTPKFTYSAGGNGNPPNVIAEVAPPPEPPPALEFGAASWVKEIRTSAHSARKVSLDELVGDDPSKPQPWANGETPEVEVEWSILQADTAAAGGGAKGTLDGAPDGMPGDEVVTRRWEFFKYVGPIDAETGEAVADTVASDGKHGVGTVTYASSYDPVSGNWNMTTVNLANLVIVGPYTGAQMSGFDVAPKLDLIEHVQEGEVGSPYPDRRVVVPGQSPFTAGSLGLLPPGLTFNHVTGLLSGTPTASGVYSFTISASDLSGTRASRFYTVVIEPAGGGTVAANDSYAAVVGDLLTIPWGAGLLANDINPTGATTLIVKNASHGTLHLGSNGAFTYQPAAGYLGADVFTYQDSTNGKLSNLATVTISVQPPVSGLALQAAGIKSGTSTTATVTLRSPAGPGGETVSLWSSTAYAKLPAFVRIPAGATSATFAVNTTPVKQIVAATFNARFGVSFATARLIINP